MRHFEIVKIGFAYKMYLKNLYFPDFLLKEIILFEQSDNIIRSLITLNELFYLLINWMGMGLGQCDHIVLGKGNSTKLKSLEII